MATTKKITLFYKLTPKEILSPKDDSIARKDEWVKTIQKTIESEWNSRIIKVTYELYNPEIENQMRFLNGPVVDYFVIQNDDILWDTPDSKTKAKYREYILDEVLGYDLVLPGKTVRRRKSTTDLMSTQKWHNMLETIKESLFDPSGYEFPDSELFWEMVQKHGYDQAKKIVIEQLQRKMAAKLKTTE